MKFDKNRKIKYYSIISLMTAIMCICSPFSIIIPFSPVPITISTFVLYMQVVILDYRQSIICTILYLFIGFIGIPVFSGFQGGPAKILGPTGGYLIGYIVLTIISGAIISIVKRSVIINIISLIIGTIFLYIIGTFWLLKVSNISFYAAISYAVLPFIVFDMIKIIIASIIGERIRVILSKKI